MFFAVSNVASGRIDSFCPLAVAAKLCTTVAGLAPACRKSTAVQYTDRDLEWYTDHDSTPARADSLHSAKFVAASQLGTNLQPPHARQAAVEPPAVCPRHYSYL